ncbi:MAG: hypothetical protein IJW32_04910 [Clostridia bacterium]|nr:hypothetical protein [Clostridia bacterium]
MSKNLFDFTQENIENNNNFSQKNNKKEDVEQAKDIYQKYKDMSQNDLINEFVSTSKQKINEGSISKEKITQTANVLTPYLNEQQRELLSKLMDKLND